MRKVGLCSVSNLFFLVYNQKCSPHFILEDNIQCTSHFYFLIVSTSIHICCTKQMLRVALQRTLFRGLSCSHANSYASTKMGKRCKHKSNYRYFYAAVLFNIEFKLRAGSTSCGFPSYLLSIFHNLSSLFRAGTRWSLRFLTTQATLCWAKSYISLKLCYLHSCLIWVLSVFIWGSNFFLCLAI